MSRIETVPHSNVQPILTELAGARPAEHTRQQLSLSLGSGTIARWTRNGVVAAGLLTTETGCPEMMTSTDTFITISGASDVPTEGYSATEQHTSSSMGTLEGTASETMDATDSGTNTAGLTDGTTIDTSTDTDPTGPTTGEMPCPQDACMPNNTITCEMKGEQVAICTCKEGSEGDQCQTCSKGYENQGTKENVDCVPDVTPPVPEIKTNEGKSPFFIATASFKFRGDCFETTCEEQQVVSVQYFVDDVPDGAPVPFNPGDIEWVREYKDLVLNESHIYSVVLEDINGKKSKKAWIDVTRTF